jgi:hypothetical protein
LGCLDDDLLQTVAAENNLSDTEGFWPENLAALGWTAEAAVPTET